MPAINIGLQTRLYFADQAALNEQDPVLRMIDPPVRRETLLAQRKDRGGETVYLFDIHLHGDRETVFVDA